jgi:hypothetical protein
MRNGQIKIKIEAGKIKGIFVKIPLSPKNLGNF